MRYVKRIIAEFKEAIALLYDKVYGPYELESGRKVVRVETDSGEIKTISYPKFVLEQHLGRSLDPDMETVDHKNYDYNDNRIENLDIIPRHEHSRLDTRRVKLIDLKCDMCGKEFKRSPRIIRFKAKTKKRGYFCSRACAGRYGRKLQLKQLKQFDVQKAVDSEYYREKIVQQEKNNQEPS